jgi:hypothetical protein
MRTIVVAFVMLVIAGCASAETMGLPDAAIGRDAALQEGGVTPTDAGFVSDAATARDSGASRSDAAVSACVIGECDPRGADSCSDAGACVLGDRVAECAPLAGVGVTGSSCTGETDCGPGLACFRDGSSGICAQVCCPGEIGVCGDPTDADVYCRADGVLASGIVTSWGRCTGLHSCDVLAPSLACTSDEGCYIDVEPQRSVCRRAGTGDVGERCEAQNDCRAGFFCGGLAEQTCIRICRLSDPRSCPSSEGRCVEQAYSPPGSGVCTL